MDPLYSHLKKNNANISEKEEEYPIIVGGFERGEMYIGISAIPQSAQFEKEILTILGNLQFKKGIQPHDDSDPFRIAEQVARNHLAQKGVKVTRIEIYGQKLLQKDGTVLLYAADAPSKSWYNSTTLKIDPVRRVIVEEMSNQKNQIRLPTHSTQSPVKGVNDK